jgi:hypothetical protein
MFYKFSVHALLNTKKWSCLMTTDATEIRETAVKNINSFIALLNENLWNSNDDSRELGSVADLSDELDSLDYDASRGIFSNLTHRFENIFFIAKRYNVQWESYKDLFYRQLMNDILILEIQGTC